MTRPTGGTYFKQGDDLRIAAKALFEMIGAGRIDIAINQTWPLAEAVEAQRALAARQTTGSTLLILEGLPALGRGPHRRRQRQRFKSACFSDPALHVRLHVTAEGRSVMAATSGAKPSRVKVQEHRKRLREQGLRPIQIWVPDTRAATFKAEAHRQSLAVAASVHAGDDQAFIDAVSVVDFDQGGDE